MERKPVFSPSRVLDERDSFRDALFSLVGQFAYEGTIKGEKVLSTGGLSALEQAFKALGLPDPVLLKDFLEKERIVCRRE